MGNDKLKNISKEMKKFKSIVREIEGNMGEVIMKVKIDGDGRLVEKWLNPRVRLVGGEIVFIDEKTTNG